MAHRVTALYHDLDQARLAVGDLRTVGVPANDVLFTDGLQQGHGRLEITARDLDHAINVKAFLEQDGAHSVEIRPGTDDADPTNIPPVPAQT